MKTTKRLISILCVLLVCVTMFTIVASAAFVTPPTLQRTGNKNTKTNVSVLQRMLTYAGHGTKGVDGSFGRNTETAVINFQTAKLGKNNADGIVGKNTWKALLSACYVEYGYGTSRKPNDAVKLLQQILNKLGYPCGTPDGIFGRKTEDAVMDFQEDNHIGVDGKVGAETWSYLLKALFGKTSTWVVK